MGAKKCVLDENKLCDDCGECNYCDLNPFKICDNCGKCIDCDEEYRELKIDEIVLNKNKKHPHTGHNGDCGGCECDSHNN